VTSSRGLMNSEAIAFFPNADSARQTPSAVSDLSNGESPLSEMIDTVSLGASDDALLSQVSLGSKDALALLFRRYRRAVSNVALRILKDAPEAEDLCQEVFLFLFRKAKQFDASKGTAASWIIQIAYHRAINRRHYLTFRQHYNAEQLDEEQTSPKRQPLFVDEIVARTLLNRVREQLSADQRHTLELHFFEGYSLREIAEKTNQTLGNIRHHYYRGLECLRSNVFPEKDA
jgi:RNA polymerase sigma-70 factor, ECF subfamily